ncbi:hypothetical protein M9H77_17682 [Catharanthus roseus]|uniref:Uncharacterized protein n=1 Tax=Catharanthus roseus TaxID=4058 RepID=A0ACC0B5A8_CATRO|nr:hypothetical protein M9H77_17682 [Catharanthus roseus]
MITLRDVEAQVMRFPIFINDNDETAQELEEFTFPKKEEVQQEIMERKQDDLLSFQESPQITSEADAKNEKFMECQEDHKEGQQETEIDDIEKSKGDSCKRLEENNEERKPLMEFKRNFENSNLHIEDSKRQITTSIRGANG